MILSHTENASGNFKLSQSLLDRALFARLSLDPNGMSDNDDTTIAIASLPAVPLFDYLVDCWKSVVDVKKNVLAREKVLLVYWRFGLYNDYAPSYDERVTLLTLISIINQVDIGPSCF